MRQRHDHSDSWTAAERRCLQRLQSIAHIQAFLDRTPYSCDPIYRCPRSVIRDRRAHCLDGALLAAAALRQLGLPPLIVNLYAVRDDDHVIAVYRRERAWGAIAKSNCTGLRFREPIYRSLRELVMSYFDGYFNLDGEKTLRGYSAPLNLAKLDHLNWLSSDRLLNRIPGRLDAQPRFKLLTPRMVRGLLPIDRRSYRAGFMGAKQAGLYRP